MTAGTVVITGGILATVILLCIIAVLCYCRLQVSVLCLATPTLHWNGLPRALVTAPSLPGLKKCLDNALRYMV